MLIKKRGVQLNQAFGAVLVVVLIAILVIIGIFLFENLQSTFVSTSVTVTNETEAWLNITTYTVDNAGACNFNTFAISSAINDTENTAILLANFTVDTDAGTFTNATALNYNNVSLTYTYLWGGEACTATDDMITQFATYPALIGLVGTIVFLGLVIGVLVASFVFGGRRENP